MAKRKKKNFLTIYTLSYSENVPDFGLDHQVAGSYARRGDAIRSGADYLIEKMEARSDVRWAFLNHSDEDVRSILAVALCMNKQDLDDLFANNQHPIQFEKKLRNALRRYLIDALGGDSCYSIETDHAECQYRVDIDENDIESKKGVPIWCCITSGRSPYGEDHEFEDAFPELFLTCEQAMQCALDDLGQWLDGYSRKEAKGIFDEAAKSLKKNGHYEFEANDAVTRVWDIWRTSLDVGMGSEKNHHGID